MSNPTNYFSYQYLAKRGDNLTTIGKQFNCQNPGPIAAFPPNKGKSFTRPPYIIRVGDRIFVPYSKDLLTKIKATSEYLINETAKNTKELMADVDVRKKDIKQYLMKIDAINFLAQIGVSIGSLAAKGGQPSAKELAFWLADHGATRASGIASLVIPQPTAPKKDFTFYVRHALGPWNPSYWASVWGAVRARDVDVWLHGADAVAYKEKVRIKNHADKDIARLKRRMTLAQKQLAELFYRQHI